jgi:hypothetical protein
MVRFPSRDRTQLEDVEQSDCATGIFPTRPIECDQIGHDCISPRAASVDRWDNSDSMIRVEHVLQADIFPPTYRRQLK